MQTCSVCSAQSPDTETHCGNCQSDLRELSNTAISLARLQSNPRVANIRLVVAHNCCPACQQVEGAYPTEDVPRLPVEGCSHQLGCRCFYEPMLSEIYP